MVVLGGTVSEPYTWISKLSCAAQATTNSSPRNSASGRLRRATLKGCGKRQGECKSELACCEPTFFDPDVSLLCGMTAKVDSSSAHKKQILVDFTHGRLSAPGRPKRTSLVGTMYQKQRWMTENNHFQYKTVSGVFICTKLLYNSAEPLLASRQQPVIEGKGFREICRAQR